jgi:DNA-binding transcriptional ArsR family regulator
MVQYSTPLLDRTFGALSDGSRREILDRLSAGPASVTELAAPLGMSLPGVLKHLRVLEDAHLVRTSKTGRTRRCELAQHPLDDAAGWIEQRRRQWEHRIDRFERELESPKGQKR